MFILVFACLAQFWRRGEPRTLLRHCKGKKLMREVWGLGLELKGGARVLDEVIQENLSKNKNGHSALGIQPSNCLQKEKSTKRYSPNDQ